MEKHSVKNSRIEILKIVAIILIILSHSMPTIDSGETNYAAYLIDLNIATSNIQYITMCLFRYCGQVGNAIFVVCSAWFLLQSNRLNSNRIVNMVLDCWIISVMYICIFYSASGGGGTFSLIDIIKSIFPISSGKYWFIGCYLLLYLIHPLLNYTLERLDQRHYLIVVLTMFAAYCIIKVLLNSEIYYYTRLVGFICLYCFTGYAQRYLANQISPMLWRYTLIIGVGILLFLILFMNYVGLHIRLLSNKSLWWNTIMNPAMVLISISAIVLARSRAFSNSCINSISRKTLLIYLIHDNFCLNRIIKRGYYRFIYDTYSYQRILLFVVIYVTFLLIMSLVLSFVYEKTIRMLTKKLTPKIIEFCSKSGNAALNAMMGVRK